MAHEAIQQVMRISAGSPLNQLGFLRTFATNEVSRARPLGSMRLPIDRTLTMDRPTPLDQLFAGALRGRLRNRLARLRDARGLREEFLE